MSQKRITIVMPFLNEGKEPKKTIESIYRTAPPNLFKIIAIDDSSEDITNIEWAKNYNNLTYIRNKERIGSCGCKHLGGTLADTPYILFIDAHMRFRNDNWCEKILDALDNEPETVFGVTCIRLLFSNSDEVNNSILYSNDRKKGFGATLNFVDTKKMKKNGSHILYPVWNNSYSDFPEVSCLLGACYAISRSFFEKLKGFEGLKIWGGEEQFLSLKIWLFGGKCKILTSVEVGHKFREKFPYVNPSSFVLYNKMIICKTILPETLGKTILSYLPTSPFSLWAEMMIARDEKKIEEMKQYFLSMFTDDIWNYIDKFNIELPN